jgi:hypothetical protein
MYACRLVLSHIDLDEAGVQPVWASLLGRPSSHGALIFRRGAHGSDARPRSSSLL